MASQLCLVSNGHESQRDANLINAAFEDRVEEKSERLRSKRREDGLRLSKLLSAHHNRPVQGRKRDFLSAQASKSCSPSRSTSNIHSTSSGLAVDQKVYP